MAFPLSNNQRETLLCIDTTDGSALQGRFYCPPRNIERSFGCLSQFLIEMHQILDMCGLPRASNEMRSFSTATESSDFSSEEDAAFSEPQMGKKATFSLRVLFRQNASWQGLLLWIEGKQEQSFRSVLELIMLINSAVQQATPSEEKN